MKRHLRARSSEHTTKEEKGYIGGGWGLEHRPAHPEANGSHAAALIGNEHSTASSDSTQSLQVVTRELLAQKTMALATAIPLPDSC